MNLTDRVITRKIGGCQLFLLPTSVEGVVSWRGSLATHPDLAAGDELVQDLVVELLDKGTQHRDRFAIAEALEDRGAQLNFASDGLRVDFSGRALRDDVPEVLRLMAEQLREPLLDPAEYDKSRAQMAAMLHRSMESTRSQARGVFSRHLYPPAHPNYVAPQQEDLERLVGMELETVRQYHRRHFGGNDLLLTLVGDVNVEAITAAVEAAFGDWGSTGEDTFVEPPLAAIVPGREAVAMPDKQNVDVLLGHRLPLRRDDDAYLPLYVANFILGGNFSARLMNTVRDEMGLTYGIGSRLGGITMQHGGHWLVSVTLSQENLEKGIAATQQVVQEFVDQGVTATELANKKTTITGSYKVNLATTADLAIALHLNAERGFPVSRIDDFPERINALTLGEVNDAIRTYFDPSQFHLAMAGTLPDPG